MHGFAFCNALAFNSENYGFVKQKIHKNTYLRASFIMYCWIVLCTRYVTALQWVVHDLGLIDWVLSCTWIICSDCLAIPALDLCEKVHAVWVLPILAFATQLIESQLYHPDLFPLLTRKKGLLCNGSCRCRMKEHAAKWRILLLPRHPLPLRLLPQ